MKLVVKKILNEDDFANYLKRVDSFKITNPFYKILDSNITEILNDHLCYFKLVNDDDEVLILMPFLLRVIPYKDQKATYFDVISPYGYSGPLFNNELSRGYLLMFWEQVDAWYKENNIVSEFIRFSLNHNHHFYSGVLVPTLTNVNGQIIAEAEQWDNFKPKVRNNYRKGIENGLHIRILSEGITDEDIQVFYSIYIQTMTRIGAEIDYFYSFAYFKNIITLSKNNFAIAYVYKDTVAISVELILIAGNTLYSYLGGTLSDFFNLRPNDFLKIEVMKWARVHGYKYYLLGGGRTDNDTLFQYKKSFFPMDMDIIYYTGRKIINKKIYKKLDTILNAEILIEGRQPTLNSVKSNFFPAYRKNAFKK